MGEAASFACSGPSEIQRRLERQCPNKGRESMVAGNVLIGGGHHIGPRFGLLANRPKWKLLNAGSPM
jgi:hypothetical protein